jgi:hypothetical protein
MTFSTPLMVNSDGGAEPLERLSFQLKGETGYSEAWLQRLIERQPTVLPIDDIESAFTPAISVCIELPLGSKFLDNLLVTPLGNLIAVECKLWRNPEARREVVAQIIDYASRLQKLTYGELQEAICQARKEPAFQLYEHVANRSPDTEAALDEPRFVDAVSRNLRRGRSLLLIAGDGVTEEAEAMTEFLQRHAGLHFALAVVQLAVYSVAGSQQRLLVPSIPLRTTNIVRGIVEINDGRTNVVPPPPSMSASGATTLTEEQFMGGLDAIRPSTSSRLREFLDGIEDLGIAHEFLKTLVVRMIVGDQKIIPFVVNSNGVVDTGYTFNQKALFRPFAEKLAAGLPGAVLKETPSSWYVTRKKADGSPLTIWDFLDHRDVVREALTSLHQGMAGGSISEAP